VFSPITGRAKQDKTVQKRTHTEKYLSLEHRPTNATTYIKCPDCTKPGFEAAGQRRRDGVLARFASANGVAEEFAHNLPPIIVPNFGIEYVILASLFGVYKPAGAIVFAEVDGELEEQTGILVGFGKEDLVFGHGVVANVAARPTPIRVLVSGIVPSPTEGVIEVIQVVVVPIGTLHPIFRKLVAFRTNIPKGVRITEINISNGPYTVGSFSKVKSFL
jgi:hypothetical protein